MLFLSTSTTSRHPATPGQQMSREPAHEQSIAMEFRTHKPNDVAIVGVVVATVPRHISEEYKIIIQQMFIFEQISSRSTRSNVNKEKSAAV